MIPRLKVFKDGKEVPAEEIRLIKDFELGHKLYHGQIWFGEYPPVEEWLKPYTYELTEEPHDG